jgi:hypothetical protein
LNTEVIPIGSEEGTIASPLVAFTSVQTTLVALAALPLILLAMRSLHTFGLPPTKYIGFVAEPALDVNMPAVAA